MKTKYTTICIAVFLAAITTHATAQNNSFTTPPSGTPNVGSPVTNPTRIPPSRMIQTPTFNPDAGNAIITGNVAGGKHFRGSVPYTSAAQFGSGLTDTNSSAVTSFLRRSAGSISSGPGTSLQPFYDPRNTVTSLSRGTGSGLEPPRIIPQSTSGRDSILSAPRQMIPDSEYFTAEPISVATAEMESLINQQLGIQDIALRYDRFLQERQPGEPDFQELLNPSQKKTLKPIDPAGYENLLNPSQAKKERVYDETFKPAIPDEPEDPAIQKQKRLEEMERELLAELFEIEEPAEETISEPKERTKLTTDPIDLLSPGPAEKEVEETTESPSLLGPKIDSAEDLAALHARAREILGSYETYQELAQARFAEYIAKAEANMKDGKFYRAADDYTLAAVWDSDNAKADLGKSIALFGAGSYISSSHFLQRAIVLDSDLALSKTDLAEILGSRDVLEDRLIEAVQWQDKSKSEPLAFLVAYVFYQDGRNESALSAIEMITELSQDNQACDALRKAIETALKSN